jgi:hypothetical protein
MHWRILFAAGSLGLAIMQGASPAGTKLEIPRTWDATQLQTSEVPLAVSDASPVYVPASFYYQIPVRPIYKSYSVYVPGREPAGYREQLKTADPIVVWGKDDRGVEHRPPLNTQSDWMRAGELVFDAALSYSDGEGFLLSLADVQDAEFYRTLRVPVSKRGVFEFGSYVIRKKGKVEFGQSSCGMCHTRVLSDGEIVKGAQGNLPFDQAFLYNLRWLESLPWAKREAVMARLQPVIQTFYGVPWIRPDPATAYGPLTLQSMRQTFGAIPAGVIDRQGSSALYPVQVPDLIGIKDRLYLDHTGLQRHRGPADLMRYAALNQGMNLWSSYKGWIPASTDGHLPSPAKLSRYSDEQLYALVLYLYSLQPPRNPNRFDSLAASGKRVFQNSGCPICHTEPLFTNNRLTLAPGFPMPHDTHGDKIMRFSINTDARLALETRRGTGFYKVPSLKGLWYRGALEHGGSVSSLEDWFNPARLRDDYIPTGFIGAGISRRAVRGHPFGLNLTADKRTALIAYLRTL